MNAKKCLAGLMAVLFAVLSLALPLPGTSTAPLLEAAASDTYPELSIEQKTLTVSEAAGQTVTLDVNLNSPALTRFLLMLHCDERLQDVEIESVTVQHLGEYTAFSEKHLDSDNYQAFLWKSAEERSFDEEILRMTVTLPEDVEPGDTFSVSYLSSSPLTGEVCEWNNNLTGMQYADSLVYLNGGIQIVEDQPTSGSCGDDLTWEFDKSTKTLTISGTGKMDDYGTRPWKNLNIVQAVFCSGVTSIGDNAFSGCKSLSFVKFPDTLSYIGDNAFGHTGLYSVVFPDNDICIEGAFQHCDRLNYVSFSESMQDIERMIFEGSENIQGVIFNNPTSYPDAYISPDIFNRFETFHGTIYGYANSVSQTLAEAKGYNFEIIENAPEISEYTLGEITWDFDESSGILTISGTGNMMNYRFDMDDESLQPEWYDLRDSIKGVVIEEGITSIGAGAFYNCVNLESIKLPDSLKIIGFAPFENCNSITSITIPSNVAFIAEGAFYSCKKLSSIVIENPRCEIFDAFDTILNNDVTYNGIIYGYPNSTAQAYAEKYGYTFESLGAAPEPTTEPTTDEPTDEPTTVPGDLNSDSTLDLTDLILLQKYLLAAEPLTAEQLSAADLDGDGVCDVYDLALMKHTLLS